MQCAFIDTSKYCTPGFSLFLETFILINIPKIHSESSTTVRATWAVLGFIGPRHSGEFRDALSVLVSFTLLSSNQNCKWKEGMNSLITTSRAQTMLTLSTNISIEFWFNRNRAHRLWTQFSNSNIIMLSQSLQHVLCNLGKRQQPAFDRAPGWKELHFTV